MSRESGGQAAAVVPCLAAGGMANTHFLGKLVFSSTSMNVYVGRF